MVCLGKKNSQFVQAGSFPGWWNLPIEPDIIRSLISLVQLPDTFPGGHSIDRSSRSSKRCRARLGNGSISRCFANCLVDFKTRMVCWCCCYCCCWCWRCCWCCCWCWRLLFFSGLAEYASKLQLQEGMFSPVSSLVFCHFFKRLREFAVATGLISDLLVVWRYFWRSPIHFQRCQKVLRA